MVVDHVGWVLLPNVQILRVIGRVSFPLFCLLIAYGCTKTRSIHKYLLRLIIFALVSQLILSFFAWDDWGTNQLNVFATLAIGVLLIHIYQRKFEDKFIRFFIIILASLGAFLVVIILRTSYGAPGVALIVFFWLAFKHFNHFNARWWVRVFYMLGALAVFNCFFMLMYQPSSHLQWWSMLSLPFVLLFTPRRVVLTKFEKYAFYAFYPGHLVFLYIIAMVV